MIRGFDAPGRVIDTGLPSSDNSYLKAVSGLSHP